ncbi:MAG: exosortase/archaeosortase family protein [Desulfobacteraceae bacterium]|nr:exosortase/archaeosortase family protein [Desulfobacteraceae bacterium]
MTISDFCDVLNNRGKKESFNFGKSAFMNRTLIKSMNIVSVFMVMLAFIAVYAPTIAWLWERWMMGIWYNAHGILIPFVSAYIIWRQLRSNDSEGAEEGSPLGFLFLVPALIMHVIDTRLWSQILSAVSIVPALIGISLLLMGRSRTRIILFPLLLLCFMIPIPSAVSQPVLLVLRKLSAMGTENFIRVISIPVLRMGTELFFPGGSVNIANPCSGFATLSATVAFTGIAVYLWPVGLFRSIVLLVVAFPVALCANILRCIMLSLMIMRYGSAILDTFLHPLSGYLAYFVAIGFQTCLLIVQRLPTGFTVEKILRRESK